MRRNDFSVAPPRGGAAEGGAVMRVAGRTGQFNEPSTLSLLGGLSFFRALLMSLL